MIKTKILIGLITLVYLTGYLHFDFWRGAFNGGDTWGYYVYLPAFLIHHDVGSYDQSEAARKLHNPRARDPHADLHVSPIGKRVVKYPVGVALLQAPFFIAAHGYCWATGVPADGFSTPYYFLTGLSSMFYGIAGIWLLLLALRPYFQDENIRLVIGAVLALATHLFYFSTYTVGMAHPYLFFLFAGLLLGVVRFYEQPNLARAFWVGAAAGLIALTRLPEVIAVTIPLLWGVRTWADVPKRLAFFRQHAGKLAVAVLTFALMLLPQAVLCHFTTGQWWYDGYQGEHFNWSHPRILDGLFNYRNGWLIYTPVMALSLVGVFWLRKKYADALWPVLVLLPLHWYIIYAWWCWNYINGFGSRPMLEVSALLAFPLGALVAACWKNHWSKLLLGALLAFFMGLNLFQTWQVFKGLLLTESVSRAYYWSVFGKTASDDDLVIAYYTNEKQPALVRSGWSKLFHGDRDTLKRVSTLASNEMEDSTGVLFTQGIRKNGRFGFRCDDEYSPGCYIEADKLDIGPGDYLRISIASYFKEKERTNAHDKLALLSVHVFTPDGKTVTSAQLAATNRTGNTQHSFWFTGMPDVWGEASYFVRLPETFQRTDRIKAYLWNPSRQKLYVDDLRVELWRYQ